MQWLTMSAPTPRTVPSRAASSTLVPTPSVEATSTGSSIAASALAENAPPKLPTPRTTSAPWVRSTAVRIWATARVPSSMSTPAAAYDVRRGPRRPPADVAADLHPLEVDAGHRLVRGGAGGGQVGPEPGDGEDPPAGRLPVDQPGREQQRRGGRAVVGSRPGDRECR